MKIIAFYLPQFHEIPENNEAWGNGFTEWTNVKKGIPLFKNHYQPHIPLDGYYSLLDSQVQERQAKQAKEYGIDAFCYYHYWFSGKLLLEKPAENMLLNPKVDLPFCFCWANEHWTRNWDGENKKIIMPQNYEESNFDLKKHYDYLSKFFHDDRYLKVGNKPVFIIYKPYLIKNCSGLISYWNELARQDGFEGIYFGFQFPKSYDYDMKVIGFDFGIEFEPLYTDYYCWKNLKIPGNRLLKCFYMLVHWDYALRILKKLITKGLTLHDYDATWKNIIERELKENIMPGAFPSWDNSPRRGKHGTVYFEATPQKFKEYFSVRYKKALAADMPFLFINAWNEWGEGAHLEPDENYKFGFLEAVLDVVATKNSILDGQKF